MPFVTHAGQPCPTCGTPVKLKLKNPQKRKGRQFYYSQFFKCPNNKCKKVYLDQANIVYFSVKTTQASVPGEIIFDIDKADCAA